MYIHFEIHTPVSHVYRPMAIPLRGRPAYVETYRYVVHLHNLFVFCIYILMHFGICSICTNVYPVISCIDMIFWYRYKDIYTTSDVYIHETHTDMFMRPACNIQGYVHDISTWPSVTILAFQLEMLFIVVTFTSHHEKQVRLSLQHP